MTEFARDPWLSFVIDHYQDIDAINEIYRMAKTNLPEMVSLEIVDSINALGEGSYFSENKLKYETVEGNEIWWFDPKAYDSELEKGAIFAFEPIKDWNQLIPGIPIPKAPWLVAYYYPRGKTKADRSEDIESWLALFTNHEAKLRNKKIKVRPSDEDPGYLAAYYLKDEVNLDVLKTPDKLRKGVQKAVKEFTSAILPIIRKKITD